MATVPLAFLRCVLDVFSNVSEESTTSILGVTEFGGSSSSETSKDIIHPT
jgi:hypothetical protein